MRTSRSASRAGWNTRSDRGPRGGVSANAATNAMTTAAATAARAGHRTALLPLLGAELREIGALGPVDELAVAVGIDERVRAARRGALRLRLEAEHAAMLGDEDVGLQIAQQPEGARVVIDNRRHARVADQMHAVVDRHAADERDAVATAFLGRVRRPRRAALCVAGREMRRQRDAAER